MSALPRYLLCLACLLLPLPAHAGAKSAEKTEAAGARTLALRKALEGADKLEIREAPREWTPPPVTISGPEKIAALVKLFAADEKLSASYANAEPVGGPGSFRLIFYKGDQVVVRLEQYSERLLRWNDGAWKGNTYMSAETETAWPRWFAENGFPEMQQRFEEWAERRKLPERKEKAFLSCLPEGARKQLDAYWKKRSRLGAQNDEDISDQTALNKAAAALLDSLGKPHDAGVAICRALGSQADPAFGDGSHFDLNEQAAAAAFAQLSKYIMPTVFESACHDPQAATGASRLFFYYGHHARIPWVLRDGVAPLLLRTAVERDQPFRIIKAVRSAGEFGDQRVCETLRGIADGKIAPLASKSLRMLDEEPSLRHLAALVLARRGDSEAARLVQELSAIPDISKQDSAALAICRCLLGERDTIQPAIFELDSYSIGYFGIAALERQGDKAALDVIINGPLPASWALVNREAVHAVQRMTGKIWYRAQQNENEVWYIKDIREWWAAARDTWEPVNRQ